MMDSSFAVMVQLQLRTGILRVRMLSTRCAQKLHAWVHSALEGQPDTVVIPRLEHFLLAASWARSRFAISHGGRSRFQARSRQKTILGLKFSRRIQSVSGLLEPCVDPRAGWNKVHGKRKPNLRGKARIFQSRSSRCEYILVGSLGSIKSSFG